MTGILQAILSFFGVTPSTSANYIEDVFSTYLYTGTGSSQTITNNIDTSTKGGLVWIKGRSGATGHRFTDTVRGATKSLESNSTAAEATESTGLTAFGTTGFTIGADADYNTNAATYVSWTFREQAKFFDIVTYTGDGVPRTISHNLGSVPGCIIVKRLDGASRWSVYHRSLISALYSVALNTTAAEAADSTIWNSTAPTSTQFSVGDAGSVNGSGGTFVAYLFAHNAGGFGASGSDNVISCGSFTTNTAETVTVNLGYEPQFVIVKRSDAVGDWYILDTMRGWDNSSSDAILYPNYSNAEGSAQRGEPNATGFRFTEGAVARTYIYIAIRRGPMKTPTSGTSVFSPTIVASIGATSAAGPSPTDLSILKPALTTVNSWRVVDRLRGNDLILSTDTTSAESTETYYKFDTQSGLRLTSWPVANSIFYNLKRAPGFFDVVCYTGTGSATTFNHNLTVVPELMIVKSRNNATNWAVYCAYLGGTNPANRYVLLNSSNSFGGTSVYWNDTAPTSTVFTVGTTAATNTSAYTYVNYLFATCAGVSKVGSYTGTGALQTINCGFTAGARFVLIKRTDTTGDWWVYDSARGITSGNDPYLFLNSTAAEVTTTNYVDTDSTGFKVTAAAPAGLNANGGTFIFLAIA